MIDEIQRRLKQSHQQNRLQDELAAFLRLPEDAPLEQHIEQLEYTIDALQLLVAALKRERRAKRKEGRDDLVELAFKYHLLWLQRNIGDQLERIRTALQSDKDAGEGAN